MRTPEQIIREGLEDHGMEPVKAANLALDIEDSIRADYELVPIVRTKYKGLEELMFDFHEKVMKGINDRTA